MSKSHPSSYIKFLLLFLALQIFTKASAQHVGVEIAVDPTSGKATVSGSFEDNFRPESGRELKFRHSVTGNTKLAERLSNIRLLSSGETAELDGSSLLGLKARSDFDKWTYSIDLRPSVDLAAAAHASWLTSDGGILMLDDLMPIFGGDRRSQRAKVVLRLPDGWRSFSSDDAGGAGFYDVRNVEGTVIFVGSRFREVPVKTKTGELSLLLDGRWLFTDAEAAQMAAEIYDAYVKMLGPLPTPRSLVAVSKFPQAENPGSWEAETRGSTVLIASSDMAFKTQSQQRLHEQLRHEIFHLWFPNAVDLTGEYTWFYEGFALYQSLKLGVELKRIRFTDFLDTLSRAYSIDAGSRPRLPLAGSSTPDATVIYARGMVLAFLADLALMSGSGGKRDAGVLLKELFSEHRRPSNKVEANFAIRRLFKSGTLERYVFGNEPIEWSAELEAAGLEAQKSGRNVELSVAPKPTGRQRAILKRLGYN